MNKRPQTELKATSIEEMISQNLQQLPSSSQPAQLHFDLGELYFQQRRFASAIKHYRQAIALRPEMVEAHQRLCTLFTQRGRTGLAISHQFKVFQLQQEAYSAEQHFELGQKLHQQQKYAQAISCYSNAIKLQPDFWQAYSSWANLFVQRKNLPGAAQVYRQGIKHNPQDSHYYLGLASVLGAQKKWVRACNNYQLAAELEPTAEIFHDWGLAQLALEKFLAAQATFQKAAELEPTADNFFHYGLASSKLQQYELAKKYFQKAIELKPNYPAPSFQLGLIWQAEERWLEAQTAYQKVARLNPKNKTVLINLGIVYRQLKQYELSLACFQEGIKIIPIKSSLEKFLLEEYQLTLQENPQATHQQYYQLGRLLRARGHFIPAISAYCESIRLEPREKFQKAYFELQYTPVKQSQLPELIAFYREIVAKYPQTAMAWGNLGDALSKQDELQEAVDCYRRASYQQAIRIHPHLADLDWQPAKTLGPDFIIAGASKSGTSSIHFYMSRHPQILLPHKKEIDFFNANYQRGIDWYLAHFPSLTDREDFLTGEATPNYLRFTRVAQRIKEHFPTTKIIVLLRNPVDRAISWHYHKLNTGLTANDLATEITQEIKQLDRMSEAEIMEQGFAHPDNILGSLYYFKLKFWIETLGREQFLILKSEDFYELPQATMATVYDWLNVPDFNLSNYPKVNRGSYHKVDSSLRKTLVEYLTSYNSRLEEYLDMQFNWE